MLPPPMTIRRKLILSISLPLLVTYLGLLAWDYYRQRTITVVQMQQTVLERAEGTAARLDTRLTSIAHTTNSLATLLESPSRRSDQQIYSALSGAVRLPWVVSATVTLEPADGSETRSITRQRRSGGPPSSNRQPVAADSVVPSWHARVKSNRLPGWTEPYNAPLGSNASIVHACTYVVPILADNVVAGSAAVTVDLQQVRRFRGGRGPDMPFGGPNGPGGGPGGGPNGGPGDFQQPGPPSGNAPSEGNWPERRAATSAPTAASVSPSNLPALDDPRREFGLTTGSDLDDFAVFDSQGRLVIAPSSDEANPPTETLFDTASRLHQPEMADAARLALKGDSQVIRVSGLKQVVPSVPDDKHHWLAMTPVSTTGWLLVTAVPESANLAPVLARLWERAAFLGVGLVVLMLVVLGVSVGISRPIERLAAAVDRVAAGDFSSEIQSTPSRDELGRLTGGFNRMTRQLRSQISALTEQTAAREKVESELRIARQIQTDLLPRSFPESPQFALHALNLPALHVAGDFYDFFFTRDGLLTLVIADVSGKGVPASLLMAVTRTLVRNLAQAGQSPAEIAEATNRALLTDTSAAMFVTMLLCQYDPTTGHLTYINAGHPPALRLRSGAAPEEICTVQSPLLGVDPDGSLGPFEQGQLTLAPGDTLFLYTDGVSEAAGPDGKLLRTSGLSKLLEPLGNASPESICRQTAARLDELCAGRRGDDITMLALRRA